MTEFSSLITNIGLEKIETALMKNEKLNLKYIAVGDANEKDFSIKPEQTALINERYRCEIEEITSTSVNAHIPENIGGFYITEVGLFDIEGSLILIAKQPKTYKPVEQQGSIKRLWIKIIIKAINPNVLEIKIDPNIETASVQFVYNAIANHNHMNLMEIIKYDTNLNGIVDTCDYIDGGRFTDGADIFVPLTSIPPEYMNISTYDINNNELVDTAENIDAGLFGSAQHTNIDEIHSYMLGTIYDTNRSGVVDNAESIDAGNFTDVDTPITSSGVSKTMNTILYDSNNDGIVDKVETIDAGVF